MPANRFFCSGPLIEGATISITGAEHHHIRVMRSEVGEEVEIVNGAGSEAIAKIATIGKEATQLILTEVTQEGALTKRIILIIPLMRLNKLEWIVEKGTELGADAFYLYAADFSEKEELSANQSERLHNLCLSALKQSGRLFLPSIELLPSLERGLVEDWTYYFGDTSSSGMNILDAPCGQRTALITGPERGFSPKEQGLLEKMAQAVSLSPNILRAETAPIAGLSVLKLKLDHN
jgi:16S rRNA (uracil1498-N3)-methyltransferase